MEFSTLLVGHFQSNALRGVLLGNHDDGSQRREHEDEEEDKPDVGTVVKELCHSLGFGVLYVLAVCKKVGVSVYAAL